WRSPWRSPATSTSRRTSTACCVSRAEGWAPCPRLSARPTWPCSTC
ncbi:MAG: hypothetical protein AVDCRST_MAG60-2299, partial [uncultured Nocardioides sp.]